MLYLTALDIGLIFRRLIEKRETGNESYEASMWLIPVSTGLWGAGQRSLIRNPGETGDVGDLHMEETMVAMKDRKLVLLSTQSQGYSFK